MWCGTYFVLKNQQLLEYLPKGPTCRGNYFQVKITYEFCYDLTNFFQYGFCLLILCSFTLSLNSILFFSHIVFECMSKEFIPSFMSNYCWIWVSTKPSFFYHVFYYICLFIIISYYFEPNDSRVYHNQRFQYEGFVRTFYSNYIWAYKTTKITLQGIASNLFVGK